MSGIRPAYPKRLRNYLVALQLTCRYGIRSFAQFGVPADLMLPRIGHSLKIHFIVSQYS
jgi:hypothetical protein